jgi:hypothetical protein
VFAITGNHDYWSGMTEVVQAVERAVFACSATSMS